ncbi:MAG TPA: YtxH domain-containing protein [Acidobacteriaceae bacterium]|nr:YtxH domain-containing protein [Acidobacteriaceae bacterium]
MSEDRRLISALKLWAVFTIGVAAGAAVALIYAPQSGEKTRRQLRRGFEDAGEYLRDAADNISESAEKYVKRGKEIADNVVDTASNAYTAARKVVPI